MPRIRTAYCGSFWHSFPRPVRVLVTCMSLVGVWAEPLLQADTVFSAVWVHSHSGFRTLPSFWLPLDSWCPSWLLKAEVVDGWEKGPKLVVHGRSCDVPLSVAVLAACHVYLAQASLITFLLDWELLWNKLHTIS